MNARQVVAHIFPLSVGHGDKPPVVKPRFVINLLHILHFGLKIFLNPEGAHLDVNFVEMRRASRSTQGGGCQLRSTQKERRSFSLLKPQDVTNSG